MSKQIIVIVIDDSGKTTAREMDTHLLERFLISERIPFNFACDDHFAMWLDDNRDLEGNGESHIWTTIDKARGDIYGLALLTSQPCDVAHVDALVEYFVEGPFAGEYDGLTCVDEVDGKGRLFFLAIDFTKSRRDDWTDAIAGLWDHLRNGSPIRTTDRAGVGTKGTRKIQGLGCDFWIAAS